MKMQTILLYISNQNDFIIKIMPLVDFTETFTLIRSFNAEVSPYFLQASLWFQVTNDDNF